MGAYRDRKPMPDWHQHMIVTDRRHTLLPALLFSLAVHAAAGGALLSGWQRPSVELPLPLTVTMEAAPPPVVESVPVQVEHHHPHAKSVTAKQPVPTPVLALDHTPSPVAIPVERINPVVPAAIPAPETAPAPTVVAKAPATVSAPGRAEAIEPPHFNVAYLNNPRPAYPPIARRLGLEGLVVLRVQVSAGGAPEQVAVAQTSGAPMLDDAAQKAVQGWTFVPARRGDTPVAHVVEVPIRFQLKN
jgi:protein TonB